MSKYANRLCFFFRDSPAVFPASSLVIYRTTSRIHLRLLLTTAWRPWSENSQLLVSHLSRVNEKWQISFFHALDSKETLISLRKKCSIEMNDSSVSNTLFMFYKQLNDCTTGWKFWNFDCGCLILLKKFIWWLLNLWDCKTLCILISSIGGTKN